MRSKRFLSLLLCVMLTLTLLPTEALAGGSSDTPSQLSAAANGATAGAPAGQPPANNVNGGGDAGFQNPFGDVNSGDWFFDDVNFIFDNGLMSGTGTESPLFSPNMPMSRAMLVTVLYRLAGSPDTSGLPNPFTDVPADTWYSSAAAWAAANSIIEGMGDGRFAPDDIITREQAATILLRYAHLIGKGPVSELTGGADFADKGKISDWALEGVMWCSMIGILTGRPGETGMLFDPQGNATRAELAAMLHRFAENVTGNTGTPEAPTAGAISSSGSGSSDSGSYDSLTVSFETNGGSDIAPVSVPRGGKLSDVPVPVKDYCAFTGWYADRTLSQPFYSDSHVSNDMTLYASYSDRDYNYQEYVDPVKFLSDCEPDVAFEILSEEPITDANLDEYITIEDKINSDEVPEIEVTSQGEDVYTISPEAPYTYTPGDTYELSLTDEDISFNNEQEEIRTMAFSIVKPETYDVQFADGILYLCWSDVQIMGDGVYSVRSDTSVYSVRNDASVYVTNAAITTGSTICLTDVSDEGKLILNENSRIRNVLSIVDDAGSSPPRKMLFTEAAGVEDVYKQLDVYLKETVDPDFLTSSFDTEKLAQDLKKSEGTLQFTRLLAVALNESQTVAALSSSDIAALSSPVFAPLSSPGFTDPKEYGSIGLTVDALVEGLSISATIGTAEDTNFSPSEADDNTWIVLSVTFDYNATIENKVQVNADFTFKEYFTFTQGEASGYRIDENGKEKAVIDLWVDAYSHTKIEFSVLVKTVDVDGYLDITGEVEDVIDNLLNEDNSDVPEILQEVLGIKGDYIDLAVIDLYDYTKDIQMPIPIFQVKLDLDFVIRLNLAVGLSAEYNLLSASRIGLRVDKNLGHVETYSYDLPGSGKQAFDLYCAGYIGVKAGIRADLSVSFYGLEDLASVGFTGEVGAYIDLYGFLHMHMTVAGKDATPDLNINGGIYMETGIYVELKIYAKSDLFKAKAEYTVLDKKFPFFTLGDKYALLSFKNAGKTVLMNTNKYPLWNGGLLDCTIIDLTTGEVTKDYNKLKDFYFTISNPYFQQRYYEGDSWVTGSFNKPNTVVVNPGEFGLPKGGVDVVPAGTHRLDATVEVYYGGDLLCYSSQKPGYTYNKINLTWIDPSVDAASVLTMGAVTATYVVDIGGVKTTVLTKPVPAGGVPGPIDLSSYCARVIRYENDWYAAIWNNTTYTVYLTPLQVLTDYIYLHDGQWHYEVYTAEAGDTFPLPADYQSPGEGNTFSNWLRKDCRFNNYTYLTRANKQLTANDLETADMLDLTHTGYDTTHAVYTFTGTQQQCYEKFNLNQKTMPVLFHNVAQYDVVWIPIHFRYPNMSYSIYGQNFGIAYQEEVVYFPYGETPLPRQSRDYPFCRILGWDVNSDDGDGKADYAYDALPPATRGATYELVVDFSLYTATFETDTGVFADGNKTATFTGDCDNYLAFINNFLEDNSTIAPVTIGDTVYTFRNWSIYYGQNSITYKAVWSASVRTYTVTFNAGDGAAFPGGATSSAIHGLAYDYEVDLSAVSAPVKSKDSNNTYTLTGWRDQDGTLYALDDTLVVQKDTTLTAVFTQAVRTYTITVSAVNGEFPDGSKTKTFTGTYEEETNFTPLSNPSRNSADPRFHYVFTGWKPALPEKFIEDLEIVAQYTEIQNEYTITFDAGSGLFSSADGGGATVTQTYEYGDVITPPTSPAKAETDYFTYTFTGWNGLAPGATVDGNRTYTATYNAVPKGGLVYSGITVTKDGVSESVNDHSSMGYTYAMKETYIDDVYIPVLTITGSGLTLSGTGTGVYVVIADTVDTVTFSALNLSVGSVYSNTLFVEQEEVDDVTINIDGDCAIENILAEEGATPAVYIDNRQVQFVGADSEASLQISVSRGQAVYISNGLTFNTLNLAINAEAGGIPEEDIAGHVHALGGEDAYRLSFIDSDVTVTSDGIGIVLPEVVIDNSDVSITAGEGLAAILASGGIALSGCSVSDGATVQLLEGVYTFADGSGNLVNHVEITRSGGSEE